MRPALRAHQVVGVDPSVAALGIAQATGTSVLKYPGGPNTGPVRLLWLRDSMEDVLRRTDARLVVTEGYAHYGHGTLHLAELWGVLGVLYVELGVAAVTIAPGTLKKFATGSGKVDKIEMVVAARDRLGYRGKNEHEADALWLREAGLQAYGLSDVRLPKLNVDHVKKVVAWPKLDK